MVNPTPPSDMVGKALHVLGLLGERASGVTLSELARTSGLPTSTCYRLLKSLTRDHFVAFDSRTKHYTLGLRVYQLGQRVAHTHGFSGVALPVMRKLAETSREAVLMSVLDGDRQLYIHYVAGPQQVSVRGEPGKHGPVHCTSMGKVLVAFAPGALREELVESVELARAGTEHAHRPRGLPQGDRQGARRGTRTRRRGARGRHPGPGRPRPRP